MKKLLATSAVTLMALAYGVAEPGHAAAQSNAEDLAKTARARPIPGTLRADTFFAGRVISTMRLRAKDVRRCYNECQKRKNCDGVTSQKKRSRESPIVCKLFTKISKRTRLRGWTSWTPTQRCASDRECSDHNACNGTERCAEDSGSLRCQPGKNGCKANEECKAKRCQRRCHDRDGDGHKDMACGGNDCNDRVQTIYGGNAESCDRIDNDCRPCTVGRTDADGDGFISAGCSNPLPSNIRSCSGGVYADSRRRVARGRDCDDSNPAIRPGSMICDTNKKNVKLCVEGAWQRRPCPSGTQCVRQPDGTGSCQR